MQNIFDGIEVPKLELNTIVSENIQKIYRLHRMKRKRKVIIYCAATIALVITGAGICVANPVLASQIPLIGHLFEKVQDKAIYSGDYSKVAEPLKKDNVDESEGLKVTLSEVYCNTEALNVSVLIESEAPFPEGVHAMEQAGENGEVISYVFMEARQTFDFIPDYVVDFPIQIYGTYLDNHTFAGSFRTAFDLGELSQVEIPQSFKWKLAVNKIETDSFKEIAPEEKLNQNGEWEFAADVTVDMDHTIVKKVDDYAPTGQGIVSATKTPYEIILEYELASADETISKEDMLQSITLDADGKRLTNKVGMIPIKGHNVSKITEYYFPARTEEEYIVIQERIYKGDQNTLEEYVKSISTYQIEINFDE